MKEKVVIVIMDGVGYSDKIEGNAVKNAYTPTLDLLMNKYPNTLINAHGTYVGLPSDEDMGNSEVGHNALGCGQIYSQGAKLVNERINSGELFNSKTWKELINFCKNSTLHLIGLLSDGNVHSNIKHLFKLIEQAKIEGIKKVRIHILLDGRDTEERSALIYVNQLERLLNKLNDENFDAKIASGGGRMNITMDRYEANYKMVEKGWHTHVLGDARHFISATEAIETQRRETNVIDQYLEPFVITENDKPIGTINDNDSVIFFNFRGDRAIEISKCFDEKDFNKFDRIRVPNVYYAGMLEYDTEAKIPKHFLNESPMIKNTLTEELCKYNIYEYAVSETQKYGHVTYFWNGNRQDKFNEELETYDKVDSDIIAFDLKPEMKSFEITDKLINAIESNKYDFLRINFPNGDMVGHTGNYEATIKAMEALDKNLNRILSVCLKNNYTLIVTADHGNAEEMIDKNSNVKTSHSLNKVPFIIASNNINFKIKNGNFGLANVASTITTLMNIPKNPNWLESIIEKE